MRQKLFFILAIVCGFVAAVSVYFYLNGASKPSTFEKRVIVVAKNKILARSMIKPEDLAVKEIPTEGYPAEGFSTIQSIAGSVALVNLEPGDLVLRTAFQQTNAKDHDKINVTSNALTVPAGKRALAIPIGLVSGVGYTVKPGDYVDVLITIDVKEGTETKTITSLAAQDVLVLNVGETYGEENSNINTKSYILALSVPQAMAVTHGSEKGTLRLMLRNPVDKDLRTDPPLDSNVFKDSSYFSKFK